MALVKSALSSLMHASPELSIQGNKAEADEIVLLKYLHLDEILLLRKSCGKRTLPCAHLYRDLPGQTLKQGWHLGVCTSYASHCRRFVLAKFHRNCYFLTSWDWQNKFGVKAYVLAKKTWLSSYGMPGPFPCGRWHHIGLIIGIFGLCGFLGEWCHPGLAFFCL